MQGVFVLCTRIRKYHPHVWPYHMLGVDVVANGALQLGRWHRGTALTHLNTQFHGFSNREHIKGATIFCLAVVYQVISDDIAAPPEPLQFRAGNQSCTTRRASQLTLLIISATAASNDFLDD